QPVHSDLDPGIHPDVLHAPTREEIDYAPLDLAFRPLIIAIDDAAWPPQCRQRLQPIVQRTLDRRVRRRVLCWIGPGLVHPYLLWVWRPIPGRAPAAVRSVPQPRTEFQKA